MICTLETQKSCESSLASCFRWCNGRDIEPQDCTNFSLIESTDGRNVCQRKFEREREREATRQFRRFRQFWITFNRPENGKSWIASFWNAWDAHETLIRCPPRRVTGIIMLNYGMMWDVLSPISQRSVNQKAREHSQRSKTGGVCGKRRREVCSVRHTRRAVQWWQNMEFCALLHINRHFVFAVFHLSSFPACLVLSVNASEPARKWLIPRATTPTADDGPSPLITPRSSC